MIVCETYIITVRRESRHGSMYNLDFYRGTYRTRASFLRRRFFPMSSLIYKLLCTNKSKGKRDGYTEIKVIIDNDDGSNHYVACT